MLIFYSSKIASDTRPQMPEFSVLLLCCFLCSVNLSLYAPEKRLIDLDHQNIKEFRDTAQTPTFVLVGGRDFEMKSNQNWSGEKC